MKIIADENLAFTEYFFAEFGDIQFKAGRSIHHQDLIDADALLVRSVTQVNQQLIENTPLKFIGSATIGVDHLDISALTAAGMAWANAAGCNAQAVAEYVVTALLTLRPELIQAKQQFCLGIVGLGNVGCRLAKLAQFFEWRVIGCDPYTQHQHIKQLDLDELLAQADAVSLHVPLTSSGANATQHLLSTAQLMCMPTTSILINTSRGPVVDQQALIEDVTKTARQVVLDVFEYEPVISERLLAHVTLATPHIAGYSLEGKARGTQMIYEAFCQQFGVEITKQFASQLAHCPALLAQAKTQQLLEYLPQLYDIRRDDSNLRACLAEGYVQQQAFDNLRKTYPLRREWSAYGAVL